MEEIPLSRPDMAAAPADATAQGWSLLRRVAFRCAAIFFVLVAAPWDWLSNLPGFGWWQELSGAANDAVVGFANRFIWHVREELVPLNGSGDTSYGWAQLLTWALLAISGGLLWSLLDRRRTSYRTLNYWLCVMLRYYLALVSLSYGIAKLFVTQMPPPSTSDLATPLGDFLPMRLAWMFFGYSPAYQFFSGLMECLAGLLLLWRRTATLGAMIAAGIFLNVAMLNLSYDIPVKIFSLEMLALSLFLLANESRRLICFFFLNRPADACTLYQPPLRQRWMRIGRIAAKCAFIALAIGWTTAETAQLYADYHSPSYEAFPTEIYDISAYKRNGTPVADGTGWRDIALNGRHVASITTADTSLPLRYGRRLAAYDIDTAKKTLVFTRMADESEIGSFGYERPDSLRILLRGQMGADSVEMILTRRMHNYQLTERQFHWLSERNR